MCVLPVVYHSKQPSSLTLPGMMYKWLWLAMLCVVRSRGRNVVLGLLCCISECLCMRGGELERGKSNQLIGAEVGTRLTVCLVPTSVTID